jgi:hypothetical protein
MLPARHRWLRAVALALAASPFGVVACGGGNTASNLVKAPEFDPANQTKCGVRASQTEPLIVEWPPAERGRLESSVRRGLVAVRYVGCEMQLVPQCRVRNGDYKYTPLTRKNDSVRIRNEDELYASLPAGAARFEAKLKSAGQLNVQMTMVGRYESSRARVTRSDLDGDCDGVTHVVTAVTVGAFTFFAGADASVGGGATVLGAGASGASAASRETLTQDGDDAACARATGSDERPPDGCGALIRLEVAPLPERHARVVPTTEPTETETEPHPRPRTTHPTATERATTAPTTTATAETGDKGTTGKIVAWTSLGSFAAAGILGTIALAIAKNATDPQSSSASCNKDHNYCTADGLAAKDRAHAIALAADGFLLLGIATGITFYFLPTRTPTTVGIAPAPGGATVGVGGKF